MEQPEVDDIADLFDGEPEPVDERSPRTPAKVVLVVVGIVAALALVPVAAIIGLPLIETIIAAAVRAGGS